MHMEANLWTECLPNIAALQILSHLDVSDVLPFSTVCKQWNSWLYAKFLHFSSDKVQNSRFMLSALFAPPHCPLLTNFWLFRLAEHCQTCGSSLSVSYNSICIMDPATIDRRFVIGRNASTDFVLTILACAISTTGSRLRVPVYHHLILHV